MRDDIMQTKFHSGNWIRYGAFVLAGSAVAVLAQDGSQSFPPGIDGVQERLAALEAVVASQASEIAALKDKLKHFSREGNEVYITGANLNILSGAGPGTIQDGTWTAGLVNGLGNLVLGYNEDRISFDGELAAQRHGSHNLVIGPLHEYTSNGGLLAGIWSTVAGPHASVVGGIENKALGFASVVSGGGSNTSSGDAASVSGGASNHASGNAANISGGQSNTAIADHATVSGGSFNAAAAPHSSVSGGYYNASLGLLSSVSGGYGNTAVGSYSVVSGGGSNLAKGENSTVSGGFERTAEDLFDWLAGDLFQEQ